MGRVAAVDGQDRRLDKGETMSPKGVKGSGVKITATSFKFDGDKLKYKLNYQGNGKAPDS